VLGRSTSAPQGNRLAGSHLVGFPNPTAGQDSRSVEACNRFVAGIDHLCVGVNPYPAIGVEYARGKPKAVERRLFAGINY
jgi:hypothetical protein